MNDKSKTIGDISFGISIGQSADTKVSRPIEKRPFNIAILGDFSGRETQPSANQKPISKRRIYAIDRDNFDGILQSFDIDLHLSTGGATSQNLSIPIKSLAGFHPDQIYQNIEVFSRLRSLRARLLDMATFADAATEMQGWLVSPELSEPQAPVVEEKNIPEPTTATTNDVVGTGNGGLLDSILESSQKEFDSSTSRPETDASSFVSRLIQEVASSNNIPARDPRQQDYVNVVDEAISQQMRKILHNTRFQTLEAVWRAVFYLVKNIETSNELKIYLIDVSKQELEADLPDENQTSSGLYKLLCDSPLYDIDWSLLVGNYTFYPTTGDVDLLSYLGSIAQEANASFISAAHSSMAGCENFWDQADPDDWTGSTDKKFRLVWEYLRQQSFANHIGLTIPRVMLRLPYGTGFSDVDRFKFQEMPEGHCHECYLWGNGAVFIAYSVARSFIDDGWEFTLGQYNQVEDLPLHYYELDGETLVKACAEFYLTERAAKRFSEAGLISIASMAGKDSVRSGPLRSIAKSGDRIRGKWIKV